MGKNSMPEGVKTVMYWVLGLGIVALIGLVMVILFGNLSGNVGFGKTSTTYYNETLTDVGETGETLTFDGNRCVNPTCTITLVTNATTAYETISSANYTTSGTGGCTLSSGTAGSYNASNWNVTYTASCDTSAKVDSDTIIANYTKSVTNTATQFPTVGTILGVAVLLVILVGILIFAIRKLMGITATSSGRSPRFKGSSSADFG